MEFEWDARKAASNVRKHGVTFDEAATVFLDERALSSPKPVHGAPFVPKGRSMKMADREMRAEYKRSDFAKLERGKFFTEVAKGTSVALIEPKLAKAFPTSAAVNEALRGLLALADETARITGRSKRSARKRAAG